MRGRIMNHSMVRLLPAALLAAALAGCASGVKRADDAAKRDAYFARGGKVAQEVTISLSKEARAQLYDNLRFDPEKLLATVRRALEANNLLAKTPDATLPKIEIVVTDIRVRSNVGAVIFGFMAGDDHVNGDVIAREATGKELQRFSVSASYALGGLAGGADDARLGWLYETFAKHTVDELTGGKRE
jgi:hypothetical protein